MHLKGGNNLHLFIFMMCGIVIGGFIGQYFGEIPAFAFLNYGQVFGLPESFGVDLSIIKFSVGLSVKINIAGILGLILSVFIYRKVK